MSARRACAVLEFDTASYRYKSCRPDLAPLAAQIKAICETRVRYGYRRVDVLLRREGWHVNQKRIRRIYNELGLQLRNKTPKRRVKAKLREDRAPATRPNDVWAMDFVHDQLATGRKIRILTVVDTFSRFSPAVDPRFSDQARPVLPPTVNRQSIGRGRIATYRGRSRIDPRTSCFPLHQKCWQDDMRESMEVELKLTCDAAALAALSEMPRLETASAKVTDDLQSVYFDTTGRALQKAGFVLRVRKTRDGYIQAAKASGDGLIERNEWEQAANGPSPDITALMKTPLAAVLGKKPRLKPLFTVLVERSTFSIEYGSSEIELALDRGRVMKRGANEDFVPEPICEIELELKRGSPVHVFMLAREIAGFVPVRIGVESKAERGFKLDGLHTGPRKAGVVRLSANMSAAEAFRSVAHACLRHMRLNEDLLLESPDPEALHQMRGAIRRLRSAFSLFDILLRDDPQFETIKSDLRRLSAPLGKARNLDVFLTRTLPNEVERHHEQNELLNIEKQLDIERTLAYAAVGEQLRSNEWRMFCLDLVEWINVGKWLDTSDRDTRDSSVTSVASRLLDKRRRQVKKRGRKLADLDAAERHQLRIAAKKLRDGTEFFTALYSHKKAKRFREFASALAAIQDALGSLNDIATGHDLLESLADSKVDRNVVFAAGLMAAEVDDTAAGFLSDAIKAYDTLIDARPFWR